jgi:hypothetical protein
MASRYLNLCLTLLLLALEATSGRLLATNLRRTHNHTSVHALRGGPHDQHGSAGHGKAAPGSGGHVKTAPVSRSGQDRVRVMFNCQAGEAKSDCESRIRSAVPKDSFSIVHYLAAPHAFSISVDPSYVDELEDAEDDPLRYAMNIKGSWKAHPILKYGGQETPFGIEMVNAPRAWSTHQTQGENVLVCGKSHQVADWIG